MCDLCVRLHAIDAALLSQCAGRRLLWEGAAQRTASMPRGLAAAFIVFAFIVCCSGEQQQALLQEQLCAAAAT